MPFLPMDVMKQHMEDNFSREALIQKYGSPSGAGPGGVEFSGMGYRDGSSAADPLSSTSWVAPGQITAQNNLLALAAARQQQLAEQASADKAMAFEAAQAEINRAFQQESADKAMAFEAAQAEINRAWYDRQRSTAYQDAVSDMKAAGLNPALAYTQGGASSSTGAIASSSQASGSSASGYKANASKADVDLDTMSKMLTAVLSAATSVKNTNTQAGLQFAGGLLGTAAKYIAMFG